MSKTGSVRTIKIYICEIALVEYLIIESQSFEGP